MGVSQAQAVSPNSSPDQTFGAPCGLPRPQGAHEKLGLGTRPVISMMSEHKNKKLHLLSIIHSVKNNTIFLSFLYLYILYSYFPASARETCTSFCGVIELVSKLCGWGCTTDLQKYTHRGRRKGMTMNQFGGPKTSIMQGRYGK